MKKTALITGIMGQDGSYLTELLLEKDYNVCGIIRRNSTLQPSQSRIAHLLDDITLEYGDVTDACSIQDIVNRTQPNEVYNLAAQSHVGISFDNPSYTANVNALGVVNILEAIDLETKFYQASSSEMFGNSIENSGYQNEHTPFQPVNPYGVTKLFSYHMVRTYREAKGMFATNGILFNHESPRRGFNFVTTKVVKGAVAIKKNKAAKLLLGDMTARRDWGHAKDYTKAMWMIMNHETPDDYIISTGTTHSVEDLCEYVFKKLNLDYRSYVISSHTQKRPTEIHELKGNYFKARNVLGWEPSYTFETMLDEMIEYWEKQDD